MQLLAVKKEWKERTLPPQVSHEVKAIIKQGTATSTTANDGHKTVALNQPYLFYGPPGSGKKMAASLIGEGLQRDVYRVDLSLIASKYIGETEKNLEAIFEKAREGNIILLFDEADGLFAKRTDIKDANDRYANIDVNYLLQKIEREHATAIFTLKESTVTDPAFLRKFQHVIAFPMPTKRDW